MLTPFPTQLSGAQWLSQRRNALLADQPRVGKTGTAILACDENLESSILVVTTASGRAVWERAWQSWSPFNRKVQVVLKAEKLTGDVVIVGWGALNRPEIRNELIKRNWCRLILDESHYAKSVSAVRTLAVYGHFRDDGRDLDRNSALSGYAAGVWCLSGTPMPNSPADFYPMLRALSPERLQATKDFPDVTTQSAFTDRYCVVRMKKLKRGFRRIPVVVGGKNLEELKARTESFLLRRTQADVGIRQPVYETLPLYVSDKLAADADKDVDRAKVLKAAGAGDTKVLDLELGPIRRHTGALKARAVVETVRDELDCSDGKIVVAFWHREVGDILEEGLQRFGVVRLDGSTSGADRATAEDRFRGVARVFLAQIQAAGEAVDLSASAELICAETSLIPKDMAQISMRITNYTQQSLPRVRVATLAGSIDEAVEEILLRKWSTIRAVIA